MMDGIKLLETRQSIRSFKPDPLSANDIRTIVNAGRLAATANNQQPWEFVVITDPEARQAIAEMARNGHFIAEAPVCIAVLAQDTHYFLEDGSAAVQNLLLAGWELGIGSCWVAGDKKPYAEEVVKLLGAPLTYRLVALVALGYPQEVPERAPKRPLQELLHWEKFGQRSQ